RPKSTTTRIRRKKRTTGRAASVGGQRMKMTKKKTRTTGRGAGAGGQAGRGSPGRARGRGPVNRKLTWVPLCGIFRCFFAPPPVPDLKLFFALGSLVVSVVATVFLFMLALKVYSVAAGVILGILSLIPCIGLFVLLAVNGKATSILRAHGYSVGLLGASLSEF